MQFSLRVSNSEVGDGKDRWIHGERGADPWNKLLPLGRGAVLGAPKETVKDGADT